MAHSPFLTVAEVAAYTRLSKETVRKLAKSGELPHIKYGDQYRIVRSAVIRDEPHACTCGAVCPVSTSSAEEASAH